jgi:hypothetical protein
MNRLLASVVVATGFLLNLHVIVESAESTPANADLIKPVVGSQWYPVLTVPTAQGSAVAGTHSTGYRGVRILDGNVKARRF